MPDKDRIKQLLGVRQLLLTLQLPFPKGLSVLVRPLSGPFRVNAFFAVALEPSLLARGIVRACGGLVLVLTALTQTLPD
jgi:hypothetical protein